MLSLVVDHDKTHTPPNTFTNLPFMFIILLILVYVIFMLDCWILSQTQSSKKKSLPTRKSKILISGGCKGVGSQLAALFAERYKCTVIILDNEDPQAILSEIEAHGGCGHFYKCDFKDRNMIFRTIAQIIADFASIDTFINTGGIVLEKKLKDYCYDEMFAAMEANFFGPTMIINELLPVMEARGKGRIVNVPSDVQMVKSQDILAHCGTKTGLTEMLRGLQAELKMRKSGVKITLVQSRFSYCNEKIYQKIQKNQELIRQKTKFYAAKIFWAIIYEQESVSYEGPF